MGTKVGPNVTHVQVAECGVFLLPYFLQREGIRAIPISAIVGVAVALVITLAFFYANSKLENKAWIAIIMCTLTCLLAIGLFAGGCHEFEEVLCLPKGESLAEGEGTTAAPATEGTEGACVEGDAACTVADEGVDAGIFEGGPVPSEGVAAEGAAVVDESAAEAETEGRKLLAEAEGGTPGQENYCTPVIYRIKGKFWDQTRFPMALFKPSGYSSKPTVLQTTAWWSWFALTCLLHGYKWFMTQKIRANKALEGEV